MMNKRKAIKAMGMGKTVWCPESSMTQYRFGYRGSDRLVTRRLLVEEYFSVCDEVLGPDEGWEVVE